MLHDGRLIYTRWDYVDRHAVHYEQLWTSHPDGSRPAAFYGNNTLNPVGTWEARPVPGSDKVMATAAAHHAMTAGSIVLVDTSRGIDGLDPVTRLTPDALFPESEAPVSNGGKGFWHAPQGVVKIEHPSGMIAVDLDVELDASKAVMRRVALIRTARRLFQGEVLIPGAVWNRDSADGRVVGKTATVAA